MPDNLIRSFMKAFNRLERYLRIEYNNGRFDENTFMGTMYRIRSRRSHPILSDKHEFDVVSQASQLRNLMVHNHEVAQPTKQFNDMFVKLVDTITQPGKVEDVMIHVNAIEKAKRTDSLAHVLDVMEETGYQEIPVFAGDALLGVFTEKTLWHHFLIKPNDTIDLNMTIEHFLQAIDLDGIPRKYFSFVARDESVVAAYETFFAGDRKYLDLLFVTEHGKKDETILGMVALYDLEAAIE